MQKWEYLVLGVGFDKAGTRRIAMENGVELANWKRGPSMFEYLNSLGQQGWEMISTTAGTTPYEVFLKRPKD